jgi:integrase
MTAMRTVAMSVGPVANPKTSRNRKRAKRASGLGTIFVQGETTWIRWTEGGRKRSMKFPGSDAKTKETAERALKKKIGDLAAGRADLSVPRPPSPPLSKLWEDFIDRRKLTIRSWRDDASRWKCHLGPYFGRKLPDEVTVADVRRFVETRVALKLRPATIRLCVALLGSFYTDLVERGLADDNIVRRLPRGVRRLTKPDGDFAPFLEREEDVRRLFLALAQPFATVFAVGVLAGLRPGEVLALAWPDINLHARRIVVARQVRHGRLGPTKGGKVRIVPIVPQLGKILEEHRLRTGGAGDLFPPAVAGRGGREKSPPRFLGLPSVHQALRDALENVGLPKTLTLYSCTRHSFAARFVLGGGSLSALREILGHHSTAVTERYGRLRSDMLRPEAIPTVTVDLSRSGGEVIDMAIHRGAAGHAADMEAVDGSAPDVVSTCTT